MATQTLVEDLQTMDVEELARRLTRADNAAEKALETARMIRFEVTKRMRAKGTPDNKTPTRLQIKGARQFKAATKILWDNSRFESLRELMDPSQWKLLYTEAHNETKRVPARMDTAKLLVLARQEGGALKDAVDALQLREYGKVTIEDVRSRGTRGNGRVVRS